MQTTSYLSCLRFLFLGEPTESQYRLSGYGIPADQLPVTESGNVKTKYLFQWIRFRKTLETTSDRSKFADWAIECPGSNDVIFRCGQAYLCHPGNVMFRSLIESMFEEHNQSPTSDGKTAITWYIINQVEQNNGRFLTWDNGLWMEMADKQQVRIKVANAFKDHKRRLKAIANCQDTHSSTCKFVRLDGKKRKQSDGVERSDARVCSGMFCGMG
jgi:hypothetical protein